MDVKTTEIEGLLIIQPRIFQDHRGYFLETWKKETYQECGIKEPFMQDNVSYSKQNVLRGLHFQEEPYAQGKLVSVLQGEILDVAVDLRKNSPTFGQWFSILLSEKNHTQLFLPKGFAHGFRVKSNEAVVMYKCTVLYQPSAEKTLLWNDPTLNIDWGIENPILSEKDQLGMRLDAFDSFTNL